MQEVWTSDAVHGWFLVNAYIHGLADDGGILGASLSLTIDFCYGCLLYLKDWNHVTHRAPSGTVKQEKAADIHVNTSGLALRTFWWDTRPLCMHSHLLVSAVHFLKTYLGS